MVKIATIAKQIIILQKIRIKEELLFLKNIECLTDKQTKEYTKKRDKEVKEGHRCFNQAKKLCLLIPNSTDQEAALKLFDIAIQTAAGLLIGGYNGVIGVLIGHLALYLKNYVSEYQQMKSLLLEAQYHYEMAAFYQDVLDKG